MAQRTTIQTVEQHLGDDLQAGRSVQSFIDTATKNVDRVVTCLRRKGLSLDSAEAELMERWLACHWYTRSDPTLSSKSTLGASGSFNRTADAYLDGAKALDPSGGACLMALVLGQRATGAWLGRTPAQQTDYVDR